MTNAVPPPLARAWLAATPVGTGQEDDSRKDAEAQRMTENDIGMIVVEK